LGTCWIGAFEEEEVGRILKIPEGIRPIAIVPVGYPAKIGVPRRKRSEEQIVHYEIF
jgi:nitroreductase